MSPRSTVPLPIEGVIPVMAYYHLDPDTGRGWVIDPGGEAPRLEDLFRQRHWQPEGILLTHGHFDHIGAADALRRAWGVQVYIHRAGQALLEDPMLNLSRVFGEPFTLEGAELLEEGDCPGGLEVLHTPGHTPDSCVFVDRENRLAFVGDTIFRGTVGATHFPGGDEAALFRSIREKILTLPEDFRLYSGHSLPTTVGEEYPRF